MPIVHINQAEVKNRFLFITVHLFILLCTGRNKMYTTMKKINHTVLYNLIFFNKHQCAANLYQICPKHKQIDDN